MKDFRKIVFLNHWIGECVYASCKKKTFGITTKEGLNRMEFFENVSTEIGRTSGGTFWNRICSGQWGVVESREHALFLWRVVRGNCILNVIHMTISGLLSWTCITTYIENESSFTKKTQSLIWLHQSSNIFMFMLAVIGQNLRYKFTTSSPK